MSWVISIIIFAALVGARYLLYRLNKDNDT